jgi:hypothetical protein
MSDERQVDVQQMRRVALDAAAVARFAGERMQVQLLTAAADELERLRAENGRYQEWWQADEDAREESRARVAELERKAAALDKLEEIRAKARGYLQLNYAEDGCVGIYLEFDGEICIGYGDGVQSAIESATVESLENLSLPSPEQESEPEKS